MKYLLTALMLVSTISVANDRKEKPSPPNAVRSQPKFCKTSCSKTPDSRQTTVAEAATTSATKS